MFDDKTENLLQEVCNSLNEVVRKNSYTEIFKQRENSIDFLLDGEYKKLIGISYYIDPRLTLKLTPLPVILNENFIGIKINMSLRARMKDFTTGLDELVQNYENFSEVKYPFRGIYEKSWFSKIKQLDKEIENTKLRLQRPYTPSRRLSVIVGDEPMPKYQILDLFSDYILKNKLRYLNGDIKIDGDLKSFYSKGTICVSENVIFDTLRENTLVSEAQVFLSALQGGILFAGMKNTDHTKFMQMNNDSKIPKYLQWPIT
jgi:hypothetical protein